MDNAKRLYEALFLVDTAQATADWDGTIKAIETVFERAEADVLSIRKWDERRLAYPVKGKERGTYFLCYFKAPTGSIVGIERDVQLSEVLIRVLVLRGDHLTAEEMGKDTPAMIAEQTGVSGESSSDADNDDNGDDDSYDSSDSKEVSEKA